MREQRLEPTDCLDHFCDVSASHQIRIDHQDLSGVNCQPVIEGEVTAANGWRRMRRNSGRLPFDIVYQLHVGTHRIAADVQMIFLRLDGVLDSAGSQIKLWQASCATHASCSDATVRGDSRDSLPPSVSWAEDWQKAGPSHPAIYTSIRIPAG